MVYIVYIIFVDKYNLLCCFVHTVLCVNENIMFSTDLALHGKQTGDKSFLLSEYNLGHFD